MSAEIWWMLLHVTRSSTGCYYAGREPYCLQVLVWKRILKFQHSYVIFHPASTPPLIWVAACVSYLWVKKRGKMKGCTSGRTEYLAGWGAVDPGMTQPIFLPFFMVLTKHKWGKKAPSGSYALAALPSKTLVRCFSLAGSRRGGNPASLGRRMAPLKIPNYWQHPRPLSHWCISLRNGPIFKPPAYPFQCCTAIFLAPRWWWLPPIPALPVSAGRESTPGNRTARQWVWVYFSMPYDMCRLPSTALLILSSHDYLNYILYVASNSRQRGRGMVPAWQQFGGLWGTPAAPQSKWPPRAAASGISNAYGSSVPGHFTAKLKSSFLTWH